MVDIVLHVM